MTSRIKRWTGVDLDDRATSSGFLAGRTIAPRVECALKTALAALEAAQAKRQRADHSRRALAGMEATVGLAGLGGLITTILSNQPDVNLVVVVLLSVATAVPMLAALARLTAIGRREAEEIAAVEAARAVAVQAAGLARALETAASGPSSTEPADKAVADEVLAHIEQMAAALHGRERRLDIDQEPMARRHVRIKPSNDRIAVTTEGGTTVIAQLVDVSISGAMIAGRLPDVRMGDEIRVGSRAAIVVRIVERGVACEFVEPLPAYALAPNVVL